MAEKFTTKINTGEDIYDGDICDARGLSEAESEVLKKEYDALLESYPTEDEIDKLLLQGIALTQIMMRRAVSLNDFTSYGLLTEVLRDQIIYLLGDEPEEGDNE